MEPSDVRIGGTLHLQRAHVDRPGDARARRGGAVAAILCLYVARNDGSTDQGPSVIAPLGSESSGYRFTLGNGSSSKMAPARMSVTGFDFTSPSKGENYGFVTTKIVLSGDR